MFVDLFLAIWILVRLPLALGKTVICDRFVIDTLIDVCSSCEMDDIDDTPWRRLYFSLIPSVTRTFILTASLDSLRERKQESFLDPEFETKYDWYREMGEAFGLVSIDTEEDLGEAHREILAELVATPLPSSTQPTPGRRALSIRWYAYFRHSALPRWTRRIVLLGVHWLFQSVQSMNNVERGLKAGLWLLVFVPLFLSTVAIVGFGVAAIGAALLAQTVNFLLNAHIPVVMRYVGLEVEPDQVRRYADELKGRILGRSYLQGAVVVGSLARDEVQSTSDLDVRVLSKPGLPNAVRGGILVLQERARALRHMFPLDIYLRESIGSLREAEEPEILCDNTGDLGAAFQR